MAHERLIILCPIFNDWNAAQLLFRYIDAVAGENDLQVSILAVDDGSTQSFESELDWTATYKAIARLDILELGRNLGHQRAIAVGSTYVAENADCDAVVVMDADGEDDPRYIPALLDRCRECGGSKVIFAQRTKRSEGLAFRCCYSIYRRLYRLLTGSHIQVGNFCIIPASLLPRIVLLSEIWNHFSAGLLRARIAHEELATIRGTRLGGSSKMGFVSLVLHGLGAISVQADRLGARSLIGATLATGAVLLVMAAIGLLKLFGNQAIPGWTALLMVVLLLISVQLLAASAVFVFLILRGRSEFSFLPKRDCRYFVRALHTVLAPTVSAKSRPREIPLRPGSC